MQRQKRVQVYTNALRSEHTTKSVEPNSHVCHVSRQTGTNWRTDPGLRAGGNQTITGELHHWGATPVEARNRRKIKRKPRNPTEPNKCGVFKLIKGETVTSWDILMVLRPLVETNQSLAQQASQLTIEVCNLNKSINFCLTVPSSLSVCASILCHPSCAS